MTPEQPSAPDPADPDSPPKGRATRVVAAAACALQALVLLGAAVFYVYELTQDVSDDPVRVVTSAVLIAVFGAALAAMARAWVRGDRWQRTPTIVWNLLLLPVAWSINSGGQARLAVAIGVVAVAGLVAALGTPSDRDHVGS